jgi:hypothetical protein
MQLTLYGWNMMMKLLVSQLLTEMFASFFTKYSSVNIEPEVAHNISLGQCKVHRSF